MAIENLNEKLAQIVDKSQSSWADDYKWREANRAWLKRSQSIAIKVLKVLRDRNKTQAWLANEMSISPQQVNKIVKGKENLTLETIAKIESALAIQLIEVKAVESISTVVNTYRRVYAPTERSTINAIVFKYTATLDRSFKQFDSSDDLTLKLRTAS